MKKEPTLAQRQAIDAKDKTLLVSAAAGSGKTFTLAERIITLLTTNLRIGIESFLVVTYTRAAASELQQKISTALSKKIASVTDADIREHLQKQLANIAGAKISTIDSFYLDVLRNNFDKLDEELSPSFRTADGAELAFLEKALMEESIEEFYEKKEVEVSKLSECFVNVKEGANLSNILINLYSKTDSLPDGIDFLIKSANELRSYIGKDFLESKYGAIIVDDVLNSMEYYHRGYAAFSGANEYDAYNSDVDFMEKIIDLANQKKYEDCYNCFNTFSKNTISDKTKTKNGEVISDLVSEPELFLKLKKDFEKKVEEFQNNYFGISPQNINRMLEDSAKKIDLLHEILSHFEKKFKAHKMQKKILSFNDIKRAAYKILVEKVENEVIDGKEQEVVFPTSTALEYRKRFSHIYIDEYQDVDKMQDNIFRAIADESARFMVGDVKQSIYGFRDAEPDLFVNYKNTFPDMGDPNISSSKNASIFMSENFRCDHTVIDFVNEVCSGLFKECKESIGYTPADNLKCSKNADEEIAEKLKEINEDKEEKKSERVTLSVAPVDVSVIITNGKAKESSALLQNDESITNEQIEAKYIAKRIKEFIDSTKNEEDALKIRPEHIAVLYRKKDVAITIAKELAALGIDSCSDADADYFENPDVLLVIALLNTIDNPQKDIYLAGVLRSPLFCFTLDELIEIRKANKYAFSLFDAVRSYIKKDDTLAKKCANFCKVLASLRNDAAAMPVDKLLKKIYSSDLFLASGFSCFDNTSKLVQLYEDARNFEASSFKGLYNFITHINKMIEENKSNSKDFSSHCEGKVSLMTIHHSKGLEFPICFLSRTGTGFSTQDSKESLVFDSHTGLALKLADEDGLAHINTPIRSAILSKLMRRQAEEEMRVLYVALTRARERLIITGITGVSAYDTVITKARLNRAFLCNYSVLSSTSFLDWILTFIHEDKSYSFCNLSFMEIDDATKVEFEEPDAEHELDDTAVNELYEILNSKFSFVYQHKAATTLPAKISVSALLEERKEIESDALKTEDDKEKEEKYIGKYAVPDILKGAKSNKITAAERGTATHLFLQFCDFENLKKNGVEAELKRLTDYDKFIPKNSKKLIFDGELELFSKSELFEKIMNAKRIYREQRFNIILPTEMLNSSPEFVEQTKNEILAVQGVIDLVIEDENEDIHLIDYKTDRLTKEELEDDNALQEKMKERHGKQIKYYAEAIRRLFDKECKSAFIYSTHKGALIEIPL